MDKGQFRVKRTHDDAFLPIRGSEHAVGYDLHASEDIVIQSEERELIKTGFVLEIPQGYYGRIAPRSSLALKHGIDMFAGVVDSDYRGPVGVILYNSSKNAFTINKGDRIAQLIITPYISPKIVEVVQVDNT